MISEKTKGDPMEETHAHQAFKQFQGNPFALWAPKGHCQVTAARPRLESQQIYRPPLNKSFVIHAKDRLFTMGSCFARNLENALKGHGFPIQSYDERLERYLPADQDGKPVAFHAFNFLNRFNAFAIAQEFTWALDPQASFPPEALVDLGNGLFLDPHAHITLAPVSLEATLERRRLLTEINKRIAHCRLIIVTLGLSELWRDLHTNLVMNFTPTELMRERHPKRFQFEVATVTQTVDALKRIHSLVQSHGHPQTQLIFTVSPVTLAATYRNEDIITANTYSKSVLRCAIEEMRSLDHVHYFPSYEMVMASDQRLVWQEDLRHPSKHIVDCIIAHFLETYLEKSDQEKD
jgi:hypothetical protein